MSEKTTLAQAISTSFISMMEDVHTSMPGEVNNFDGKFATVKPLIKKVFIDGDVLDLPNLVKVPIIFPRTKTSGIVFPISRGDGVLLLFTERAIERWKSTGSASEPGDPRRFDLSDAVAIPGLFSEAQDALSSSDSALEIHNSGQTITIKKNGDLEIGGSNLKALVNEAFLTAYDTHTHTSGGSGSPTTPPLVPSNPLTQLTQKTKAQ